MTREALERRYADTASRFVTLDNIRVHYKDEGPGPAVLLVHGTFGDLGDWDGWVEHLSGSYRIVRLDLPAFGLTGKVPNGNYSIDRYLSLVDSLMDHLGLESFAIVGNSYGGLVAFRYAATRTERVNALILINSAGIEYGGRRGTGPTPKPVPSPSAAVARSPREQVAASLHMAINDPSRVTDALIQRKVNMFNVEGRDKEAVVARDLYERGDPQRVLSHVRAAVLIEWGGANKALSPETAQAFADALTRASSVEKILYEGGGHLLHVERPAQTAADAKRFLDAHLPRPSGDER
jgi:pimeloyl-ACP methyl ester carboxylesterase